MANLGKGKTIAFWALRLLLALLFIATAAFNFSGMPIAVKEFAEIGFGQWFRFLTAGCELAGAVLLLTNRTGGGAASVVCLRRGVLAQLLVLHQDVINTIVLALLVSIVVWQRRDQLPGRSAAALTAGAAPSR